MEIFFMHVLMGECRWGCQGPQLGPGCCEKCEIWKCWAPHAASLGWSQHQEKHHPHSCVHHSSSTLKIWLSSPHLPQKVSWNWGRCGLSCSSPFGGSPGEYLWPCLPQSVNEIHNPSDRTKAQTKAKLLNLWGLSPSEFALSEIKAGGFGDVSV